MTALTINKSAKSEKKLLLLIIQAKKLREWNTPSNRHIIILLWFLISLILVTLILKFHTPSEEVCVFFIDTEYGIINIVNEKFLSLGLDSTVITDGFEHFNMTDPKLIKMIKYLSPAYLRIGGNAADQIIFCNQQKSENCSLNETGSFILSDSDWLKLHHLATSANIFVIYDLNSLLRYENGSWNADNAEEMIQFSHDNGLLLDWELGNEPNSYEHKFNTSVDATQLGVDYVTLRNILDKYELYKISYLVGPSTTRLRTKQIEEYFAKFLISGSQAVNAITWHHYYFSGINATASEFLNPNVFNYLHHCIKTVNNVISDLDLDLNQPIWLGETSSAWHSGAPNLSDRFIAGFIWIDKLGLSAKMGIDVVVRQSIFKGHYALLNNSYYPNPDWWLSILYKKLVSVSVIKTSYVGNHDGKIRLYAHCAESSFLWNYNENRTQSALVVFGVNLHDKEGFVQIENLKSDSKVYVFELTSESSLFSRYVRLNGKVLNLLPNLELPAMKPKIIIRDKVLTMPAYSIVFWVFTGVNASSCIIV